MLNQLKLELKRAFSSSGMLLSLGIGIAINLIHITKTPPFQQNYMIPDFESYPLAYPCTVIENWIGADLISLESFLFYMLMPLLAALPFASSFFYDKQSGYLKNVYVRMSRTEYLITKYISVFISAGVAIIVPLIINLSVCMILMPNILPQPSDARSGIGPSDMFSILFYTKPTLYLILFLILNFIFAGLFACISLTCSFFTNYKIIVLICPFFVQLILDTFCDLIDQHGWSCTNFLRTGHGIPHFLVLIIYLVLGIAGTTFGYFYKGVREDVF